jgi:hypothetical protein
MKKINRLFFVLSEFVLKPVDDEQQVNAKGRIFHFRPSGIHAYIQVLLIAVMQYFLCGIYSDSIIKWFYLRIE